MNIDDYRKLARQGKLAVQTVNQRGQKVQVKVLSINPREEGQYMIFTNLSPLLVTADRLIVLRCAIRK